MYLIKHKTIESKFNSPNEIREFIIKPSDKVVVKIYRAEILYLDSLTLDKAEAKIMYTINENNLPPPPPPID